MDYAEGSELVTAEIAPELKTPTFPPSLPGALGSADDMDGVPGRLGAAAFFTHSPIFTPSCPLSAAPSSWQLPVGRKIIVRMILQCHTIEGENGAENLGEHVNLR